MDGERLMSDTSLLSDLDRFALELRRLAYTMPAGHEDRLVHLSERMAERAHRRPEVASRGA